MNTGYEENNVLRVVFVGDMRTGKTTLINRISNNQLDTNFSNITEEYNYTLGVEFVVLYIDNKKMLVYDCSGNEKYVYLTIHYIDNADIIVFVYSINNMTSFANLQNIYQEYKRDNKLEDKKIIIVCNMIDIIMKKSDPYDKFETIGKEFADTIGASFVMLSSKTGENVKLFFEELVGCYRTNDIIEHNEMLEKSRCEKIKECCSIL